eukprot:2817266-Pleurochrysis_carterae.AAC.1
MMLMRIGTQSQTSGSTMSTIFTFCLRIVHYLGKIAYHDNHRLWESWRRATLKKSSSDRLLSGTGHRSSS